MDKCIRQYWEVLIQPILNIQSNFKEKLKDKLLNMVHEWHGVLP